MSNTYHESNVIHPSASIGKNVKIGKYNIIGKNVVIEGFKNTEGILEIGDSNIINDNTRIFAGKPGIRIGDWNVFHNNMLVMAEMEMLIGHNCWFGQNTILDATGGLEICNGVRVGMYSQIWTHVASGELIEGCTLFGKRKTTISDDVWLVGSCIVSSGVTLGKRSIYLIGSNVTKSTEANKVYAGNPAKVIEKMNFYREVSLDEKMAMMLEWVNEFKVKNKNINISKNDSQIILEDGKTNERVLIINNENFLDNEEASVFCLKSKKYTKKNSKIEREIYKFLYNNKARFIPL